MRCVWQWVPFGIGAKKAALSLTAALRYAALSPAVSNVDRGVLCTLSLRLCSAVERSTRLGITTWVLRPEAMSKNLRKSCRKAAVFRKPRISGLISLSLSEFAVCCCPETQPGPRLTAGQARQALGPQHPDLQVLTATAQCPKSQGSLVQLIVLSLAVAALGFL